MSHVQLQSLFAGLAAILLLSRVLALAARKVGQPPVVGEILAGILLGPTLLHGDIASWLLPRDVRPMLTAFADLGLVLFLFVVGYELDLGRLRGSGAVTGHVAVGSLVVPFCGGVLLALALTELDGGGRHGVRVLFLGTAMAATALPVLARILDDHGMHRTRIGGIALTAAAAGDVVVWGLLALTVTLSGGADQWHILLTPGYLALLVWGVRPLLRRILGRGPGAGSAPGRLAAVTVGLLLSAWAAEWLGLHFIFGAFLFGVVMPRDADVRLSVVDSTEQVGRLLLPVFFVVSGLAVDLTGIGGRRLVELLLIVAVAATSKFGGVYLAARLRGLPRRQAATLGTLMNTRGLTEIVIVLVGYQLGIIDASLYSMMVVMALVTTAMTGPLLRRLRSLEDEPRPPRHLRAEPDRSSSPHGQARLHGA